jgi:dTDP-4-amino-4,6-dideoxygalactose transaminase
VLVSSVTIPDMVRILEHHGLTPVPVDLDSRQAAPLANAWEDAVTTKTRAILVAHLFGSRIPLEPILDFAKRHGLLVFEDCAQAFAGTGYAGHPQADASMFSFGVIKSNTALGGAVLRIRDRETLARMHAAHATYPVQSRLFYLKRLLKYGMLKILSGRAMCSLFVQLCRLFGGNYDRVVNRAARGFPGDEFFEQIRRQPSPPLLAVLLRRLTRFDAGRSEKHVDKGRMLTQRFQDGQPEETILCPGGDAAEHSFWVFPLLADEPARLIEVLARHGFDATQGQSLCVVSGRNGRAKSEAANAKNLLSKIVFLPFYPEMPACEARRMASVVLGDSRRS